MREIQTRLDEIGSSLVSGELLRQQTNDGLAREYATLIGEINGLLYIQKLIEEDKAQRLQREEQEDDETI